MVRGLAGEVAGRRRRSIVYHRDIRVLAGGFQAFDDQGGVGGGRSGGGQQSALGGIPLAAAVLSMGEHTGQPSARNRNRGSATYPALLAAFVGTVGASFAHEVGVGSRSPLQRCRLAGWTVEAARFRDGSRRVKHIIKSINLPQRRRIKVGESVRKSEQVGEANLA